MKKNGLWFLKKYFRHIPQLKSVVSLPREIIHILKLNLEKAALQTRAASNKGYESKVNRKANSLLGLPQTRVLEQEERYFSNYNFAW